MTNIRRYLDAGNVYFLTHVTYKRMPILIEHFDLLWTAIQSVKTESPFELIAWVIMPDHMHMIIDPKNSDLPEIIRTIKLRFSGSLRSQLGMKSGRFWQYRYWDHIIRNENDFRRHLDYIHYNPVKHGLATRSIDYPHSSFSEFVAKEIYPADWGDIGIQSDDWEFGE
jgi:putative transposase